MAAAATFATVEAISDECCEVLLRLFGLITTYVVLVVAIVALNRQIQFSSVNCNIFSFFLWFTNSSNQLMTQK